MSDAEPCAEQAVLEEAEEGLFLQWASLPLVLQHAVGAAAAPHKGVTDVRLGCRPLRDGVDAARTRLRVTHDVQPGENRLQMLPMAVDAARFRGLKGLHIRLLFPLHRARSTLRLEGPPSWLQELHISLRGNHGMKLRSLPPAAHMPKLHTLNLSQVGLPGLFDCAQFKSLQRLVLSYCHDIKHLANLASCPSLRVLDINHCSQLASGLEPDVLSQLQQLEQLVLVKTRVSELDVSCLSPSLTHLDVQGVGMGVEVQLSLPVCSPCNALCHLGLREGVKVRNWDLSAAPNLETLDTCRNSHLPQVLDLSGVPHLKHLNAYGAALHALHLSAACSSLVSLDVSFAPLQALDLTGCTAITQLDFAYMRKLRNLHLPFAGSRLAQLHVTDCSVTSMDLTGCTALTQLSCAYLRKLCNLDLTPVGSTLAQLYVSDCHVISVDLAGCTALKDLGCSRLTHMPSLDLSHCASLTTLNASICVKLTTLNLAGCTALTQLHIPLCKALTQLDLSGCASLQGLDIHQSGVAEVDVSACTALTFVRGGQRVVGAGAGMRIKAR